MTPEELFDEILDNFEERLTLPTTHYKLLRAAAHIRLLRMDFRPLTANVVAMKGVAFVVHVPERHALVVQSNDPEDGLSGKYRGSLIPR